MEPRNLDGASLEYHERFPAGKLTIECSKPCATIDEMALAYSPGVAAPCKAIKEDEDASYRYTMKGNTVGVITDGSAVLGLGNIGPSAAMPVMEGKCMLFKKFSDINGIPLSIAAHNPEELIHAVRLLEANFGGINLEDIKAPECFEVEEALQTQMNIPVFHDDQHGTAVIVLAALWNSLELVGKNLAESRVVVNGAGAAGIACARMLVAAGLPKSHVVLVDSYGVVYNGRSQGLNRHKQEFSRESSVEKTLEDACQDADIFIGVSKGNTLTPEMISGMNENPIIFALANPDPEIMPESAKRAGARVVATGRSDFPNQVNNVLGFPGIFRGVLDIRAACVNQEMKMAAARALKNLVAKEKLSEDYVIPNPFDTNVVPAVARAVAQAAADTGVARGTIKDFEEYESKVRQRINKDRY